MGRRKCLDFIIVISYLTLISNLCDYDTWQFLYFYAYIYKIIYIVRLYVAAVPLDSRYPQNRIVHLFAYNKLYYSVNNTGIILVYYNVDFNNPAVSMSFYFFYPTRHFRSRKSCTPQSCALGIYIFFIYDARPSTSSDSNKIAAAVALNVERAYNNII